MPRTKRDASSDPSTRPVQASPSLVPARRHPSPGPESVPKFSPALPAPSECFVASIGAAFQPELTVPLRLAAVWNSEVPTTGTAEQAAKSMRVWLSWLRELESGEA